MIIIYHEKSQLNSLVWGSLTLAPIMNLIIFLAQYQEILLVYTNCGFPLLATLVARFIQSAVIVALIYNPVSG